MHWAYALHIQLKRCCNMSREGLLWGAHDWSQVSSQLSSPNIHSNGDLLCHCQSLYWVVIRHLSVCTNVAVCNVCVTV